MKLQEFYKKDLIMDVTNLCICELIETELNSIKCIQGYCPVIHRICL